MKKEYTILGILLLCTVLLTLLFSKIYLNRNKEVSIFYDSMSKITVKELEQYSIENSDVIYYLSNKYNLDNEMFEGKLKNKLEEKTLLSNLVYININKSTKKIFKKIYNINIETEKYPILIFVVDKKVIKVVYVNENSDIDNLIDYEVYE